MTEPPAAAERASREERELRPSLRPGLRLRYDAARDATVLLGPERILVLEETAAEVLRLLDGRLTLAEIVERLAQDYAAEPAEIEADLRGLLAELAALGCLR